MSDVKKLTPHDDGARRRMIMKNLTNIAILPGGQGANPEANVTFFKQAKRDDETEAQFQARMRREREANKQGGRRPGETDAQYRARMRRANKQGGPRNGESFPAFLRRMMEDDDTMTESRARRMFDRADKCEDVNKRFGILNDVDGHSHVIDIVGPQGILSRGLTTVDDGHVHEWVRRDNGEVIILTADGHTHDVIDSVTPSEDRQAMTDAQKSALAVADRLLKEGTLANLGKTAETNGGSVDNNGGNPMSETQTELDALKAQLAKSQAVNALSAAHKSHYDGLDEASQGAFLKMDAAGRDASVKAAETADPVVYKSEATGREFRMTDDPALVEMAKQMDADRKENANLRKAAVDADLTKRAEADLANHPGSLDVRKALLSAVDAIEDETLRKAAGDALKAKSAQNAGAFSVIGTDAGIDLNKSADDSDDAANQITKMAKDMAAKSNGELSFEQAYVKVLGDPANANVTKHLAI